VCVKNAAGNACSNIEFDHNNNDAPLCFDSCTKHALVHEKGSPRCVRNHNGKPCKDIEVNKDGYHMCFVSC
jgi:hypothetical protein